MMKILSVLLLLDATDWISLATLLFTMSELENTAYEAGCTVELLLYTVAISIRDRVIDDLNFNTKLLSSVT